MTLRGHRPIHNGTRRDRDQAEGHSCKSHLVPRFVAWPKVPHPSWTFLLCDGISGRTRVESPSVRPETGLGRTGEVANTGRNRTKSLLASKKPPTQGALRPCLCLTGPRARLGDFRPWQGRRSLRTLEVCSRPIRAWPQEKVVHDGWKD
jgi:hypothetical protein